jgi:hypothetical protein
MPRLIVDDSGAKRAFRLGTGRLTIGSDPGAKLRLSASGVSAQHAILRVDESGVFLEAQSEVEFAGQRRTGTLELPLGATVALGAAKLTVAADQEEAPPVPARAVPAKPVAARASAEPRPAPSPAAARPAAAKPTSNPPAAAKPGGGARVGRGRAAAEPEENSGRGGARRRGRSSAPKKGGLPGWAVPVGVLVLGGIVAGIFLMKGKNPTNASAMLNVAEGLIAEANMDSARKILADFDRATLAPELQQKYDDLKKVLDSALTESAATKRNRGIRFAQEDLLNYVDRHIKVDAPQKERVRLFLERLADFRQQYPEQRTAVWLENGEAKSILDQLNALEVKFTGVASMTEALGPADVDWARTYFASGGKDGKGVREYQPVFDRLAKAESTGGVTPERAASLRGELTAERNLYIEKRMQDAGKDYERFQQSNDLEALRSAANKLIYLILKNPDPAVWDTVSGVLLKFPNLAQEVLPSWRDNRPDEWQTLLRIPGIASLVPQMPPDPKAAKAEAK